jgi:Ribbon-helix-helix protein, copG family
MREIKGTKLIIKVPTELKTRVEKQRKKERRSVAEFVRRVLDRYLLQAELRGSEISPEALGSIQKNKDLLKRLRNS